MELQKREEIENDLMDSRDMEADEEKQQLTLRSLPPAPRSDPWLVFIHGSREQHQTFYNISEVHYQVKSIRCMRQKFICTSSHGWLVLSDLYSDDCSLLSPISMEEIQLPPLKWPFIFDRCVLSAPPSDPSCIVLFITNSRPGFVSFMFCRPNDDEWVEQEVKLGDDYHSFEDAICCDGKIYGLVHFSSELFVVDVANTILTVTKMAGMEAIPKPLLPEAHVTRRSMVESSGELYVVQKIYLDSWKPYEIQDMEVFKKDYSRKVWERVTSIGDRAFFLGRTCTTSCSAKKSGIAGNTIYFTWDQDRSLYAFNLEDQSMTVSLPCPNVKNHWSQPEWVSTTV